LQLALQRLERRRGRLDLGRQCGLALTDAVALRLPAGQGFLKRGALGLRRLQAHAQALQALAQRLLRLARGPHGAFRRTPLELGALALCAEPRLLGGGGLARGLCGGEFRAIARRLAIELRQLFVDGRVPRLHALVVRLRGGQPRLQVGHPAQGSGVPLTRLAA
jgi:hypothetical protein